MNRGDIDVRDAHMGNDFLYFLRLLMSERRLIMSVAVLMTGLATAYAFFYQPIYQSTIILKPPKSGDVAAYQKYKFLVQSDDGGIRKGLSEVKIDTTVLNDLKVLRAEDIYEVFARNLASDVMKAKFFDEVYFPSASGGEWQKSRNMTRAEFNNALVVVAVKKSGHGYASSVSVTGADSKSVGKLAEQYVAFVGVKTREELNQDVDRHLDVELEIVRLKIGMFERLAAERLQHRLASLKSALKVAKAINLEEPLVRMLALGSGQGRDLVSDEFLYMQGSRALKAQIEVLSQSESMSTEGYELGELRARMHFLQAMRAYSEDALPYAVDSPVEKDGRIVKPNKIKIILLGIGLGVMLGVLAGILRYLSRVRLT